MPTSFSNETSRDNSEGPHASEKHPWYADRWRDDIAELPDFQRDEMLFMLAARWTDDIRTQAKLQREVRWHFINWPFKPEGEPESVRLLPSSPDNILTAFAENERVLRSKAPDHKRGVALAWLLHLVGDIHQPLRTIQLFSREYPNGDRGGNEMCVRLKLNGEPIELDRFWDGVMTSSGKHQPDKKHCLRPAAPVLCFHFQRTRSPRA